MAATEVLSPEALATRRKQRQGICVEPGCAVTDLHIYECGTAGIRCSLHEQMMTCRYFERISEPCPWDTGLLEQANL